MLERRVCGAIGGKENEMLVKFQSQAAPELRMLRGEAEYLLGLIGKRLKAQGVITQAELPAAIQRLEAAEAAAERIERAHANLEYSARDERMPPNELSQRAWPFLQMMRAAERLHSDILWGL